MAFRCWRNSVAMRVVEQFRALGVARCVFRLPPSPRDEALPVLDRFNALMERSR